ncbi:chemotaxis protein CheD [Pseudooceanicola nanhaiensis]|uniref:chemotaxis protein CheD n=1 Tax=Pseudooceanicola nanhaiensis TaxID=375761 RepID=UPI001CD4C664|nr:chemotaxis protein CheD [Pseudooceanicola nanhaiensis]MCA0921668.1 chemotaxis protein CheD [Pseudooceanicola nanhaiensis]
MRRSPDTGSAITITQDEYAVSDRAGVTISTILGSCVATCLWDPVKGVGGMNHILVAHVGSGANRSDLAGINAMELVINGLIRLGAERQNLRAKVFGGAKMISGLSDIGQGNGRFALDYLERERIPCLGQSLGGTSARQVRFYPAEGRVLLKIVSSAPEPMVATRQSKPAGNDVELF